MLVDLAKLPAAADIFVERQLLPTLPEGTSRDAFRWLTAGALALTGTRALDPFMPALKSQGIVTETGQVDTAKLHTFMAAAFAKQATLACPLLGHKFTFDSADGDALIGILEAMP